jgi:hypothetical protein
VHGHWTRGSYGDGNGGHCLVGALLHLSRKHRLPLVINMINSSSGGVEKPCTTPAQTSAFIGLKPRKFIATPIR